jgi:hypothetical protein
MILVFYGALCQLTIHGIEYLLKASNHIDRLDGILEALLFHFLPTLFEESEFFGQLVVESA